MVVNHVQHSMIERHQEDIRQDILLEVWLMEGKVQL